MEWAKLIMYITFLILHIAGRLLARSLLLLSLRLMQQAPISSAAYEKIHQYKNLS